LFIDDKEIVELLKNYDSLKDDVKETVKNMLKALNLYSNVKSSL